MPEPGLTGILYVVATPIGNLQDITYRAVRILQEVDLIACEDTRHSRILLDAYGISKQLTSYHEHNEAERAVELIDKLQAGVSIALITDAGTPLVSDPGYRLVERAVEAGIQVCPLPGASAFLAALTGSGMPTDSFHFGGFLPVKTQQRRKLLLQLRHMDCSLIFYEAPHRILESLEDVAEVLGKRPVVLTRELTKVHEEFLRGTAAEILAELRSRPAVKGEMTLVIGKPIEAEGATKPIAVAVEELVAAGMSRMDAMKAVARERGMSKSDVYAELAQGKNG